MKNIIFVFIFFICKNQAIFSQFSGWLWANSAIGKYTDEGESITVDSLGNIYAFGNFRSDTIFFDGKYLINIDGNRDIFIVKYNPYGSVIWAKRAGGISDDFANGILSDKNGNLFLIGNSYNAAFFDSVVLTTFEGGAFLVKCDTSGNVIWAKSGRGSAGSQSVAFDDNGNSYIGGIFHTQVIFDSISLIEQSGSAGDIFITKFDVSGNVLWAKSAGGKFFDRGNSIVVDANNNAYLSGNFASESILFGSTTIINNDSSGNGHNGFIVKYDSLGNILWAKKAGEYINLFSSAIDINGNLYISGSFWKQNISFDFHTLTNIGTFPSHDLFLVKYDSSGNVIWAKSAGGNCNDWGNNIQTDQEGNIYIAGTSCSSILTFDTISLTLQPQTSPFDGFIAKYDSNGNAVWAKNFGGRSFDYCNDVAVDKFGNCYIIGSFTSDTLNIGNTFLVNTDTTFQSGDVFVAKIGVTVETIEEEYFLNNINVFPNPATTQIKVTSPIIINEIVITDLAGQIVYFIKPDEKYFSFQFVNAGIYFVTASINDQRVTKKLIVLGH